MFTLRKKHFEEGNTLSLITCALKGLVSNNRKGAIAYRFVPLGFTPSSLSVACRVTRYTVTFSESYPSSAKHKEVATWERIDLRLDVQGTLTDHVFAHIKDQMSEYLETYCTDDGTWVGDKDLTWFATLDFPTWKRDFERVSSVRRQHV